MTRIPWGSTVTLDVHNADDDVAGKYRWCIGEVGVAGRRLLLARQRKARGLSQEDLAELVGVDAKTIGRWERGEAEPQPWLRPKLAECLDLSTERLDDLLVGTGSEPGPTGVAVSAGWHVFAPGAASDELEALELGRRVAASDVGEETLARLELVVDELATAYTTTSPAVLLHRVRQHLGYVDHLLDARKTLAEHRRLLVSGGWLSLLGATLHIDLNQYPAAAARLTTAASLARHSEHDEIRAWCFETEAWRVLTEGRYDRALELSRAAQALAPQGSSAAVQATAQEGRAWARLQQPKETYAAIDRVHRLVSPMPTPDSPEHHYRYDPDKSVAYTATTLAWLGDPAAEGFARDVIARLGPTNDVAKWPRRVASANLDLALSLLAGDRLDEACDATLRAISSGRVVPSNHWRAAEVVQAVEARQLPEAAGLREAYEEMRRR
jgi:transcriptional regulator with XRE-family HTH domain